MDQINEMLTMKPDTLQSHLESAAAADLKGAFEQAKIFSYHAEQGSPEIECAANFCAAHLEDAIDVYGSGGDILPILSLIIDKSSSGHGHRQEAEKTLVNILETEHQRDPAKARDMAFALKANLLSNELVRNIATDFLIESIDTSTEEAKKQLINLAGDSEGMNDRQKAALLVKILEMKSTAPYETNLMLRDFVENDFASMAPYMQVARDALDKLSNEPAHLIEILRREYDMDVSAEGILEESELPTPTHTYPYVVH